MTWITTSISAIIRYMNYDPTNAGPQKIKVEWKSDEQSFLAKVFNWMFLGLASSGVAAFLIATNPVAMQAIFANQFLVFGLMIGLFAMVWNLSANIHKMSPASAAANFFIYSALNGVLLSSIFAVYTASSIFTVFAVTALTFGTMALYGSITKRDLSGLGSFAGMALIGLIIAQLVNMFLHNTGLASALNYIGVLIFVVMTAYDVQKIKSLGSEMNYNPNTAVIGALVLYLDFINLFIFLLRILGNRRDD